MTAFSIEARSRRSAARAGVITTPRGRIPTPAFIPVATKASVKALLPDAVRDAGAAAVIANAYHLYLEPGPEVVAKAGGVGSFMGWSGPTMTDSGGFQVFSLGEGFGKGGASKFGPREGGGTAEREERLATVDEDGVSFRSPLDGSSHRFTPERAIEIEHALGADIIFSFDECASPAAGKEYQREAMERTHRWAERSLARRRALGGSQLLFGIVQGGRFPDLRRESARAIARMGFDGFGIGGSFSKEDLVGALAPAVAELPEEKPRHLLGIGEPEDLFLAVESGMDTFDCVAPTRIARTGTLYTREGKVNILAARYRADLAPVEEGCPCPACARFSRAYLAHLFRAEEMLAATLASLHNLSFIISLAADMRRAVIDDRLPEFRDAFLSRYHG